jgi:hypothetical protein
MEQDAEEVIDELEPEQPAEAEQPEPDEPDDDEVTISIGDEPPPPDDDDPQDSTVIRELRRANREKDRELRELKARTSAPAQPEPVQLGPKPTLESSEYDEAKFEADLESWHARKRVIETKQAEKARADEEANAAWQQKVQGYTQAKAAVKVPDFEEAESAAVSQLSGLQQGVILNGADKPELLIYALGKNPSKLKEFAAISDPVKFAFAVAKLETQLKVTPRKSAPLPERSPRGSAPVALKGANATLAKLEAEADRTGDRTAVAKFKKQMKAGA